jgi:hypothetical protein
MKKGACGCRNHKGGQKIKYPSREAALDAIIQRGYARNPGGATPYACRRMEGVWHIRTGKKGSHGKD